MQRYFLNSGFGSVWFLCIPRYPSRPSVQCIIEMFCKSGEPLWSTGINLNAPFPLDGVKTKSWQTMTPCPAMAPIINKMMINMTQKTGQDLLQATMWSWYFVSSFANNVQFILYAFEKSKILFSTWPKRQGRIFCRHLHIWSGHDVLQNVNFRIWSI